MASRGGQFRAAVFALAVLAGAAGAAIGRRTQPGFLPRAGYARGGRGRRLFSSPAADWLYSAPTGPHEDISALVTRLHPHVYTGGPPPTWNWPVQYTNGAHGVTVFNDFCWYGRKDQVATPNVRADGGGWTPSTGSDGHLTVINTSDHMAYDFWRLCVDARGRPKTCPRNCGPRSVGQITAYDLRTSNGAGGGTSSGILGLAGDILPGELAGPGPVRHALSAVAPGSMMSPRLCSAAPATHTDGTVPGGVFCEGAKLRLDPSFRVDALPASAAAKAILKAMQRYGAVITDQTGCDKCLNFYSALPSGAGLDLTGLDALMKHLWIYRSRERLATAAGPSRPAR